jgi:hypothetical protein
MGRNARRVIMIFGRDSSWVSTCLLLRWVAPYSGRSISFQFGDGDHSNGGVVFAMTMTKCTCGSFFLWMDFFRTLHLKSLRLGILFQNERREFSRPIIDMTRKLTMSHQIVLLMVFSSTVNKCRILAYTAPSEFNTRIAFLEPTGVNPSRQTGLTQPISINLS